MTHMLRCQGCSIQLPHVPCPQLIGTMSCVPSDHLYMFSFIPSERKHSPFKGDVKSSMKGWGLTKARLSRFSMGHVINISNLDMGFLGSLMEQEQDVAQRKKVLRGTQGVRLLE